MLCLYPDSYIRLKTMFTPPNSETAPPKNNLFFFSRIKTGIILYLCSGELSQMDAMHLHVLLYESKIYLFLINYLFIIA